MLVQLQNVACFTWNSATAPKYQYHWNNSNCIFWWCQSQGSWINARPFRSFRVMLYKFAVYCYNYEGWKEDGDCNHLHCHSVIKKKRLYLILCRLARLLTTKYLWELALLPDFRYTGSSPSSPKSSRLQQQYWRHLCNLLVLPGQNKDSSSSGRKVHRTANGHTAWQIRSNKYKEWEFL